MARLAETAALTAAVPVLGRALRPDDPFFIQTAFFWPLFAPVLVSLRYGVAAGAGSTLAIATMIAVDWTRHGREAGQLPFPALVAVFALSLVCGQFSETWERSAGRVESALETATSQLSELTREHFLLEISHDRLEASRGCDAPTSLRAALSAIHEMAQAGETLAGGRIAGHLMAVLASTCLVDIASLYEVHGGRLVGLPAARLGHPAPVPDDDELVVAAARGGQLVCAPHFESAGAARKTHLILASPLTDSTGHVRAVLCVQSMSFLALAPGNLRVLAVTCGHAADLLARRDGAADRRRAERDEFEVRIARAARDVEQGIPTTVVCLVLRPESPLRDVAERLLFDVLRTSDYVHLETDDQRAVIAVILAGTDQRGAEAFERRVRGLVARELGNAVPRLGNSLLIHRVSRGDTRQSILGRLRTKDLVA
ncbi:MAG: hypothetical protein WBY94_01370 [Polyangiaceae bacterium]